jgi:short-subunit dehydrogenase
VARREEHLKRLIESCRAGSPQSSYLAGDLGVRAFAEHVIDDTMARQGRIDVLVNNAAITKHKQIWHLSADEVERVMAVNFLACAWTTLAALPHMLLAGSGTIVNVSSFAAEVVPPREAAYAASKAALHAFTQGLWNDLQGSNLHAALVIPGAIDTEIWGKGDEPLTYGGRKAPPQVVTDAIFEAIERRRHEITAPRRRLDLNAARALRRLWPAVLRAGMRRMDPVPAEIVERARAGAQGKRGAIAGRPLGLTKAKAAPAGLGWRFAHARPARPNSRRRPHAMVSSRSPPPCS